ncbi:DUF2207 domain-containing protein [Leucobacter sp. CSA1]|uniref:DUF2207 domain-containing protein n=1 Tax=Leucobacter chromiisoli TaxID=2796471 RepID=A0A934UTP4_9MICO|nr:DUF2207 domain-containing protein [Leucobacter chromiisoli]MBK0417576.1 DUF2207 domain-containing protein [Leucobacter chromiisoli]
MRSEPPLPSPDFFDLAGSDPELLNSGRIPDPQPEHTPLFRWLARVLTAVEARLRARGDSSIRFGTGFGWALVALVGLFLLFGPVINKPLDFDEVIDAAEVSEVDWIARDATIDYAVTRDGDGGFAAQVSERYTAHFVNGSEPGIERAFVTEFQGHDSRFELHEATIDGTPAEVDVDRGATVTRVAISRADGADLEGEREIEISYEMHDLVATEADTATGAEVDRWSWPILGPSWPQATQGVEVSLTLAPELDEALVRPPHAYVGWLLLSGNEWLEPEEETAAGVRYSFSNDDTLPPHAELNVSASFAAGTFAQPPTTPLFWLQTWGPLIPLALLAVLLLFALAARRVVWADSAGEDWYLPRSEAPDGLSPVQAAQLLGKPRHAELVDELSRRPGTPASFGARRKPGRRFGRKRRSAPGNRASTGPARSAWLAAVARAGMRAGRIGTFASVARRRSAWSRRDAPVEQKLRWVPDSYVRDTFLFGSLAIMLLQWGLLRQLSHQVILTIVWWPALFVLASTVLALAAVWAVLRPRPLTRAGALAVQQLKGIDVWARATRLLDRGPVDDPLLPYAVLFERPGRAGRRIAEHAGREAGDRRLGRAWRTEHFVSLPAVLALLAAVAVLAGSIVTVSTRPAPYGETRFLTWPSTHEMPGAIWSQIEGFEIEAELTRDESGDARLEVLERDAVRFTPGGGSVPQLVREWPSERLGQDLGLEIESVRIDGAEVPFREIRGEQTRAMTTQLSTVLDGLSEVEIAYSLRSPVVEAPSGRDGVQQMRWAGVLGFWDDTYYADAADPFGDTASVRPLRVQLTVAPDVAAEIRSGGWIDYDGDLERVRYEDGNSFGPWTYEERVYDHRVEGLGSPAYDLRIGSETVGDDGSLTVTIDADAVESREAPEAGTGDETGEEEAFAVDPETNDWLGKHELSLSGDLGAVLNFDPGAFANVEEGAYERYRVEHRAPYAAVMGLTALLAAASIAVTVFALRLRRRAGASLATVSFAAIPIAGAAQVVLGSWAIMSMPGSNAEGGIALAFGTLMWAAVVVQATVVVRRRAGAAGGAAVRD